MARFGKDHAIFQRVASQLPDDNPKVGRQLTNSGSNARDPKGGVMKRNLIGALTLLVLALVVDVPLVSAQSKAKADVPFAFNAAQTQLPTGTYTVSVVEGNLIQIRNDKTNKSVVMIAQHEESAKAQNPRLVFHKYGDKYFLAEAWCGSGTGLEIPAGKLEREMRAASSETSGQEGDFVLALR
jgi:hypothetical protein